MPIHLRAEPGDYADVVLCPGDPRRASYIAKWFLDPGARAVNEERGLLGFTGTYQGQPISVQTTGMGCPSAGIVFEELIMLGAKRLIRVGTCGGLQERISMGDVIVAVSATADDTTPLKYAGLASYAPTATFDLAITAARLGQEHGRRVHVGPVVSSNVFYDPAPQFTAWKRAGLLGVEMEAAMMYTVAAVHGIEALAMMVVSDLLSHEGQAERISDAALKQGIDEIMQIACELALA